MLRRSRTSGLAPVECHVSGLLIYGSPPLRPDRGWMTKPDGPPARCSDWSPVSPSPNGSGWSEWRGRRMPTASRRTCVKRACRNNRLKTYVARGLQKGSGARMFNLADEPRSILSRELPPTCVHEVDARDRFYPSLPRALQRVDSYPARARQLSISRETRGS
jgi:hypothetical protein